MKLPKSLQNGLQKAQKVFQQVAQTGRLMVGVGDYATYLEHMRECHPTLPPLSEVAYFRRCQQARYPSQAGTINRCPC